MSISISFRTEEEKRDQIDRIAAAFDRDRSWVVNEALDQYIDTYQYQVERIEKSVAAVKAGRTISHEEMLKRIAKFTGRKAKKVS